MEGRREVGGGEKGGVGSRRMSEWRRGRCGGWEDE